MLIHIASRRLTARTWDSRYPDAVFLDVTSRGSAPWYRLSPFYPHGGIPVPFSPGVYSVSVEGIWQGLKVFEATGIAPETFANTTMRGIKRTTRANGPILGHRMRVGGMSLLSYADARRLIYLPSYAWVLRNCLQTEVETLRLIAVSREIVLLDFDVNESVDDLTRPLSHASLIRRWIEDSNLHGGPDVPPHAG